MNDSRPFAGIEVVEFGQFIAVPFCGQLLAEGGARVIKVESLEGDPCASWRRSRPARRGTSFRAIAASARCPSTSSTPRRGGSSTRSSRAPTWFSSTSDRGSRRS